MTEDISLAQILGHKLLPGAAALSVGQSYKDFYVVENQTLDRGQDATSTKSQRHPL
jgi:hypothetical protein